MPGGLVLLGARCQFLSVVLSCLPRFHSSFMVASSLYLLVCVYGYTIFLVVFLSDLPHYMGPQEH